MKFNSTIVLSFWILATIFPTHAESPKDQENLNEITPLLVLGNKSGEVVTKKIEPEELGKNWVHLNCNSPHRALNPEQKIIDFEGPEIKKIINDFLSPSSKWVYAVGSDNYIAQIPAELIQNHPAILAFKEDGKIIKKHRGGRQVIFSTEKGNNPIPDDYIKKANFWAWYVESFIVDDLSNSIFRNGKSLNISKFSKKGVPAKLVPFSTFSYEKIKCPEVYLIPINSKFLGDTKRPKGDLNFLTLSGRTIKVDKDDQEKEAYGFLAAMGGKAIPVACGGPFLLIKLESEKSKGKDKIKWKLQDYRPLIYSVEYSEI